jgi:peptide/nickel transport system permease protein
VIFNIPGMGREVYNAIFAKDWPIVYSILMLVAILTMLGNLMADILYAVADPRISYRKS